MVKDNKLDGARAFFTLDRDLRFVSASQNARVLWHKTRAEIVGKSLFEVLPHAEGSPTHMGLLEASRTFRPVRVRDRSAHLAAPIEVEIYPVAEGLQVSFSPVKDRP